MNVRARDMRRYCFSRGLKGRRFDEPCKCCGGDGPYNRNKATSNRPKQGYYEEEIGAKGAYINEKL